MTVSQALERLAAYEKQAFAYNHASGVLYYDGATVAPKGSADVRADTLGELSRMSYILTTAPETVEMLQTLVQARDRLDPVTAGRCRSCGGTMNRPTAFPRKNLWPISSWCPRPTPCGTRPRSAATMPCLSRIPADLRQLPPPGRLPSAGEGPLRRPAGPV